ncbi:phosphonate-transporting ATPase [Natronococcus jeotgali DSM 18795]|uniref:Phosphonate-transporting ATPase n=2 Tax=Natronococcus jeotgali TaxID=413812 RepID=L9XKZ0_9EURY|nr:phosphonate-transporting ATPase [Natronococcus jeotgali DSM 18795]
MTPTESTMEDRPTDAERYSAIHTDGLTKAYSETIAVEELDLEIETGTIYGLLGPNGAGKTTTIRLLTGLSPPTDGSARVGGVPVGDREALVDHIGYLPESPPIRGQFTGREQLEYHGQLRDMAPRKIDGRIEELRERLELDAVDDRIVTYSKGMRRKTGVIQAIMHEPSVVFLDEPTAGLDPRATRTVREVITELADNGTTVFLSTHILPIIEAVADRVGILNEGEILTEGSPEELVKCIEGDDPTLEDVFLSVTADPELET